MQRHKQDLPRFAIMCKQHAQTPLPSHFNPACFTVAAIGNFDHLDENSLCGMECSYDNAITLFQIKPVESISNQERVKLTSKT